MTFLDTAFLKTDEIRLTLERTAEGDDMRLENGEAKKCVYRSDLSGPPAALRRFRDSDAPLVRRKILSSGTEEEALALIRAWNIGEYQGRYFEMFAVTAGDAIAGTVSLYHHTAAMVSDGVEIFPEYRRRGYARTAVEQALAAARDRGYTIAQAQIRTANAASIALHESLGFASDRYEYLNQKGEPVYLFLKSLV